MLPIKSKYKIGKRLGAGIFEQLQTQKFALSDARAKKAKRGRAPSDYGRQLLEKQRVRYTYGITEKQLYNYAKGSMGEVDPSATLHKALEMRADSAVYRAGFAPTRRAARQAVSHGHFTVNGRRITTPSYRMKQGDVIAVRDGAKKSPLYAALSQTEEHRGIPKWLASDFDQLKVTVEGEPSYTAAETGLNYSTLFEFYSR